MNKTNKVSKAFSFAAGALAVFLLSGYGSRADDSDSLHNARLAADWELKDLTGKTVLSADFKGKVVILDFWATWCPPCRAEIPGFIELQKKYAAQGFTVIGVSVDKASLKTVKSFAEKKGINYPVVLADTKVTDAFGGIDGLPTTFVIDRTGHIKEQHLGFTDKSELETEIKPLLKP